MTDTLPMQLPPDWHQKPNAARMYDYWLGGVNNFPADRAAADHLDALIPDTAVRVRANRQFLQRVVQRLAEAGVDQFLDLGSGLPSVGSVHEIVQSVQSQVRVVYVDSDPIVVVHAQNLLRAESADPGIIAIHADIRSPATIIEQAQTVLDFSRPVAILFFAVLHFIPDDAEAALIVEAFRTPCTIGSFMALTHVTDEQVETEAQEFKSFYNKSVSDLRTRTTAELTSFFGDWSMLPPGVVPIPAWHPDEATILADRPGYSGILGGVARKTA